MDDLHTIITRAPDGTLAVHKVGPEHLLHGPVWMIDVPPGTTVLIRQPPKPV